MKWKWPIQIHSEFCPTLLSSAVVTFYGLKWGIMRSGWKRRVPSMFKWTQCPLITSSFKLKTTDISHDAALMLSIDTNEISQPGTEEVNVLCWRRQQAQRCTHWMQLAINALQAAFAVLGLLRRVRWQAVDQEKVHLYQMKLSCRREREYCAECFW